MGELADRINRLANDVDYYPTPTWAGEFAGLVNDVADLEQRCAMMEQSLAEDSVIVGEFVDPGNAIARIRLAADFRTRLADAEQRAAAAWAAVTELLGSGTAITSVARISSTSLSTDRDDSGWHTRIDLVDAVPLMQMQPASHVAVLTPSLASRNPDLLERAGVELAEAYQRAKAEEQRQAELKAAAT